MSCHHHMIMMKNNDQLNKGLFRYDVITERILIISQFQFFWGVGGDG